MSFSFGGNLSGGSVTGGDSSRKLFFCHQCNRTVAIVVAPSDDPICPDCNEGFLEEYENPNPIQTRISMSEPILGDPLSSLLPFFFPSFSAASAAGGHPNPTSSNTVGSDPSDSNFDPVAFLQNHIQGLRSGGAQIQFVVENRPSDNAFRIPAIGDYFFGPGLEQLIQQLAENDPNRYGTPPASKSAIETLPTIKVTDEIMNSEMNQCAVCQDDFEKDMEVKQMPCKHIYHSDCLLPWLELHNSCPVCRFELPTDDTDYETTRRGGPPPAAPSESGERGGDNNRTVRRTFSITLPFPFGGGSSGDGGSNPNSGDGGSHSNSGGQ